MIAALPRWQFKPAGHARQFADDLEAGVIGSLFKLTEIAPAYLRLVCEIVL
jgi:hypothetical protein